MPTWLADVWLDDVWLDDVWLGMGSGGGPTPGVPAALAVLVEPGLAVAGFVFGQQPVIQVVDELGDPVLQAGIDVTVAKQSGTGTLAGTLTRSSNALGQVTFTDLQFDTAGAVTLRFTASGLTADDSGSFAVVAAPTKLVILQQPGGAVAGHRFTQQPIVELQDDTDTPVLLAGLVVTATITTGTGTLLGTVSRATVLVTGRAVYFNLRIDEADTFHLTFASGALTEAESDAFDVAAGSGSSLEDELAVRKQRIWASNRYR